MQNIKQQAVSCPKFRLLLYFTHMGRVMVQQSCPSNRTCPKNQSATAFLLDCSMCARQPCSLCTHCIGGLQLFPPNLHCSQNKTRASFPLKSTRISNWSNLGDDSSPLQSLTKHVSNRNSPFCSEHATKHIDIQVVEEIYNVSAKCACSALPIKCNHGENKMHQHVYLFI